MTVVERERERQEARRANRARAYDLAVEKIASSTEEEVGPILNVITEAYGLAFTVKAMREATGDNPAAFDILLAYAEQDKNGEPFQKIVEAR